MLKAKMKSVLRQCLMLMALIFITSSIFAESLLEQNQDKPVLLGLQVDQVNVDVAGVELAVASLNAQIQSLAEVINTTSHNNLSEEDKLLVSESIQQINTNAAALTIILQGLPAQIDHFNQQLPKVVEASKEPLANLQQSLLLLNESTLRLKSEFPELLNQSQQALNDSVDSFLSRIVLVLVFILLLVLALIIISLWLLNKKVIQPIKHIVEVTSRFPEQQQQTAEILNEVTDKLVRLNAAMPAKELPIRADEDKLAAEVIAESIIDEPQDNTRQG